MLFNLPNVFIWLRILAISLLIAVFYLSERWLTGYERNLISSILFAATER